MKRENGKAFPISNVPTAMHFVLEIVTFMKVFKRPTTSIGHLCSPAKKTNKKLKKIRSYNKKFVVK